VYEVRCGDRPLQAGRTALHAARCAPAAQGRIEARLPEVRQRTLLAVSATLTDERGAPIHETEIEIVVHPRPASDTPAVFVPGVGAEAVAAAFAARASERASAERVWLIPDASRYFRYSEEIDRALRGGACVVFTEWPAGEYCVAGERFAIRRAGMGPRHFVQPSAAHPLTRDLPPQDFRFWFDESLGRVSPILETVLVADGWTTLLLTGDGTWQGAWGPAPACGETRVGRGTLRVCQVKLAHRRETNPAARRFARRLLSPPAENGGEGGSE
jgi:hypothetical protein